MSRKLLFIFSFLITACCSLMAQQIVKGKVTDENGAELPGVNVLVKGTAVGTATDAEGSYSLSVPADQATGGTLVFSFIGYLSEEMAINGQTTVDMRMIPDILTLGEVVVVGYGTQTKKDVTGSMVAVTDREFNKGQNVTADQLIMGKVAGVQITSNGGAPGSGSQIRIRGGSSLNASNDPLIVIDGVPLDNDRTAGSPNPLSLINPDDIESFNILKDASATAIYGSRASNGVIIITTKKGNAGDKMHVHFSSQASIAKVTKTLDVLNADEFREVVNKYASASDKTLVGTANTDWQDAIFRDAYTYDNNLSLSGAFKNVPYRLSVGRLSQEGVLLTSKLERTSAALNLNPTFLDNHLKVNMSVKGLMTESQFADESVIGTAAFFDPTQPIYADYPTYGGYFEWLAANGNPIAQAQRNPVSILRQQDGHADVKRSIGNLQLDYKLHFLPDLRANVNVGYDISESDGSTTLPPTMASVMLRGGSYNAYTQKKQNNLLDFYLNYVKELPALNSKVDVTAGYSYQSFTTKNPANATISIQNEADTLSRVQAVELKNVLVSFFGRLNYSYKDRYLLTATLRRDGSSRFSPDSRWGTFPSVALAWRVIEEPFMKDVKGLTDLKVRAGFGVTGQQDLGATSQGYYPYLARYVRSNAEASYLFGDAYIQTLRAQGYDFNIKWEETRAYNAGIDYEFLMGKIYGSVDYYEKKTKDLLAEIPLPAGSNLTNRLFTNVGEVQNRGVEVSVNAKVIDRNKFKWDVGVNATFNKNEVLRLSKTANESSAGIEVGEIGGGVGNRIQIQTVGYAPYSFYVYKQVYNEQGMPLEGVYEDLTGDGKITAEDKYRYHNPAPSVFLGFNTRLSYDRFTLSLVARASFRNYVYNNNAANAYFANVSQSGTLINIPAAVYDTRFVGPNDQNRQYSDHFVENASFLRMDNINLNYHVGKVVKEKLDVNVSATCQNVFVITDYSGLDPETSTGLTGSLYPRPRVFSLGLTLDF
jgi:TonB-dependent starch-binding outer membrane protein SusC